MMVHEDIRRLVVKARPHEMQQFVDMIRAREAAYTPEE